MSETQIPVGARVMMFGDHPWSGHSGVIVDYQVFTGLERDGERPIVELDNGMRTTAFKPCHIGKVPQ